LQQGRDQKIRGRGVGGAGGPFFMGPARPRKKNLGGGQGRGTARGPPCSWGKWKRPLGGGGGTNRPRRDGGGRRGEAAGGGPGGAVLVVGGDTGGVRGRGLLGPLPLLPGKRGPRWERRKGDFFRCRIKKTGRGSFDSMGRPGFQFVLSGPGNQRGGGQAARGGDVSRGRGGNWGPGPAIQAPSPRASSGGFRWPAPPGGAVPGGAFPHFRFLPGGPNGSGGGGGGDNPSPTGWGFTLRGANGRRAIRVGGDSGPAKRRRGDDGRTIVREGGTTHVV